MLSTLQAQSALQEGIIRRMQALQVCFCRRLSRLNLSYLASSFAPPRLLSPLSALFCPRHSSSTLDPRVVRSCHLSRSPLDFIFSASENFLQRPGARSGSAVTIERSPTRSGGALSHTSSLPAQMYLDVPYTAPAAVSIQVDPGYAGILADSNNAWEVCLPAPIRQLLLSSSARSVCWSPAFCAARLACRADGLTAVAVAGRRAQRL